MRLDRLDRRSSLRVGMQAPGEKIVRARRDLALHLDPTDLGVWGTRERGFAGEDDSEDDAESPNIGGSRVVRHTAQNLCRRFSDANR